MFTGLMLFAILSLVSYLVLLPLIVRDQKAQQLAFDGPDDELLDESMEKNKEAVFTSINEIEFDYQMQKLSEDDYLNLKNRYRQQALEILHEEDESELEPEFLSEKDKHVSRVSLEAEIEKELDELRRRRNKE